MPGSFTLEIVTPARKMYEGDVTALQAPGEDGYFGVLFNRAPLIAALGPGQVTFTELSGGKRHVALSGGFFQLADNRAVILAEDAEFGEEIDQAQAEARAEQARQRLQGLIPSEFELDERRTALRVAMARVKAASSARR